MNINTQVFSLDTNFKKCVYTNFKKNAPKSPKNGHTMKLLKKLKT